MLFRSDRKSTRLNSSHTLISYAVFCLKKKKILQSPTIANLSELAQHNTQDVQIVVHTSTSRTSPTYPFKPSLPLFVIFFFFFNDTATTEIYPLSLHELFR